MKTVIILTIQYLPWTVKSLSTVKRFFSLVPCCTTEGYGGFTLKLLWGPITFRTECHLACWALLVGEVGMVRYHPNCSDLSLICSGVCRIFLSFCFKIIPRVHLMKPIVWFAGPCHITLAGSNGKIVLHVFQKLETDSVQRLVRLPTTSEQSAPYRIL